MVQFLSKFIRKLGAKVPKLPVRSILIIGPAWVGDMVMAQTLFIALKQLYPQANIDVLAPEWSRPLLERMPEVRRAIALPIGHGSLDLALRKKIGLSLRTEQYSHAYILPNSFKSALIPWWAKIPKRIGWNRELRSILLTDTRTLNKQQYPLMIERFMALAFPAEQVLAKPYPHPHLQVIKEKVDAAQRKFQLTLDKPVLALCPGAEFGPAKRWPEAHYAEIAKRWLKQGGQVWLFGSKNDRAVCENILTAAAGQACINLAGETSLGEAIDLLSLVTAAVSNDSGLMHLLAALNKPIVAVYGSSSPEFTPPLGDKIAIVRLGLACSPCFKRNCPLTHLNCLNQLMPEQVYQALEQLIQ